MDRLPFASPAWVALMHRTLEELVAADPDALRDVDFSMCEIISRVPPDDGAVVLGARFRDGGVAFFEDAEAGADYVVRGDYEAMLPGARLVHRTATPDDMAAQAARRRMTAAGRLSSSGDMSRASKPLLRVLARMHDRMAERTA